MKYDFGKSGNEIFDILGMNTCCKGDWFVWFIKKPFIMRKEIPKIWKEKWSASAEFLKFCNGSPDA